MSKLTVLVLVILTLFTINLSFSISAELEISPYFDVREDVIFSVFTRQNLLNGSVIKIGDRSSLQASKFNESLPTRMTIHGWNSDGRSEFSVLTTAAYLQAGDFNVIVVDWGKGARVPEYTIARLRIVSLSRLVAEFLDFLHLYGSMNYKDLIIIGYSLGAHAAGLTGKILTREQIGAIVALDPARPLFSIRDPSSRLHHTDAEFVMSIHTNGGENGIGQPISHADFFPNGGRLQPGCDDMTNNQCSHRRSVYFFEESIREGPFLARRCNNMTELLGDCHLEEGLMGGDKLDFNLRGIYNLRTNDRSPFAIR